VGRHDQFSENSLKLEDDIMRLHNKIAIVTGATGGIGEATAKLFLQEGAKLMLVGRSSTKLSETSARLGKSANLATYVAEASDEAANAAAIKATIAAFGGVDIMVANAGTEGTIKPVEQLEIADFEEVLRTNVLGV
jgi:NADP-dependent 3-hydroxy acid dehydrogenase YdfG